MTSVFDLPNEVLFQVLDSLEASDLDSLYAIPAFKARLANMVCVLLDEGVQPTYKNIDNVVSFQDFIDHQGHYKNSLHCVILDQLDPSTSLPLEEIAAATDGITSHVIFKAQETMTPGGRRSHNKRTPGNHISSHLLPCNHGTLTMSLTNEEYNFVDFQIPYNMFRFPNAKKLALTRCTVKFPDPNRPILCPVLENLNLRDTPIAETCDVLHCPSLSNLLVAGPDKMIDWNRLPLQTLTRCVLSLPNVAVFENICLPELENLTVEGPYTLRHLEFANLKKLAIESPSPTLVHDVHISNAKEFVLRAGYVRGLFNVVAPSLTKAGIFINASQDHFEQIDPEHIVDFSFLDTVESLDLGDFNYGSWYPQRTEKIIVPRFAHLKQLKVFHDLTPETLTSHLPEGDLLTELKISIISLSSDLDISSFVSRYPKLSILSISMSLVLSQGEVTMKALEPVYPSLEEIYVTHDAKLRLAINTSFPSLVKFSFVPLVPQLREIDGITLFSMTAPKLTHLTLLQLPPFTLDLSVLPLLQVLRANNCLQALTFGETGRELRKLNIEGNAHLKQIAPITLPNLHSFVAKGVPESAFDKVATPLIDRGDH